MRLISYSKIVDTVKEMCMRANYYLPEEVLHASSVALGKESSPLAKSILKQYIKNAETAEKQKIPICQDTGFAVFFVKVGTNAGVKGGLLKEAITDGMKAGYKEGYLRKSILKDPLYNRNNTEDNSPAIIHFDLVPGNKIDIVFMPKGGGAENMSRLGMLPPSAGEKGVIDFVVETVVNAGGNPCPPTVVGVGLGGNFETVALLSKKALLHPLKAPNKNPDYNKLEKKILKLINNSGVGPQGLGGNTTSYSIHIETHPCHLASLPIAVNINCHAHRYIRKTL